jgi:hypothetical protein
MTRTTKQLTSRSFFPEKESVQDYIVNQLRDYASQRQIMMQVEYGLYHAIQTRDGWGKEKEQTMTKEQADVELKKARKVFKRIKTEGDEFWEQIIEEEEKK